MVNKNPEGDLIMDRIGCNEVSYRKATGAEPQEWLQNLASDL